MTWVRIGDMARVLDEEPHVLRFWESEFRLRPNRMKSGQRAYTESQQAKLCLIRFLLREEFFTIEGARRQIARLNEW